MRRNAILIIALVVAVGAIFLARGLLRPKKQGLPAVTFASAGQSDARIHCRIWSLGVKSAGLISRSRTDCS